MASLCKVLQDHAPRRAASQPIPQPASKSQLSSAARAAERKSSSQLLTRSEIDRRIREDKETLIVFHGGVYNLTKWIKYHPGGELAVQHMNGRDSTDVILAYHPDWVIQKKMTHFYIGELDPCASTRTSAISKSYRNLDARIRQLGYYDTDYWFYIREGIKFLALWIGVVYFAVVGAGSVGYVLTSALLCAFLWHQGVFVAHDAGHSGITHDQLTDTLIGISLANFIGGLSLGWWKKNHNVHHIVTNHPSHDPDIQHLPFFAVSPSFAKSLYSTYYNMTLDFDSVAQWLVPLQHRLFYIVLAFGRFNLYVNCWAYVTSLSSSSTQEGRKERVPYRTLEICGMLFFLGWYLSLMMRLETWGLVVMHVLVSHLLTVLLHVQITISHFGMDTSIVENEGYAEMALRTTMDVECPRWLDWLHGGLQFQIEHHLFPRVPRHNLRKIRPLVEEFAKSHNLPFHTHSFFKGNWVVLERLREVGEEVGRMGVFGRCNY